MTYLIVHAVHFLLANAPSCLTLYCADFYLGEDFYSAKDYDTQGILQATSDVRRSYYLHDVFSVHANLREHVHAGDFEATGALDALLQLTGTEFAGRLENRWGETGDELRQTSRW